MKKILIEENPNFTKCIKIVSANNGKEMVVGNEITNLTYIESGDNDFTKWVGEPDPNDPTKKLDFIKVGTVKGFTSNNVRYSAAILGGPKRGWRWGGYWNREQNKYYSPPAACLKKKLSEVPKLTGTNNQTEKTFINPTAKGY